MNRAKIPLVLLLLALFTVVAQIHAINIDPEDLNILPPEIIALFAEELSDVDYVDGDEMLSESFSSVSRGQFACFLAGLNLRNGPCGAVLSTTTGTLSGTVSDVVSSTCLGRTWTWVNINGKWGALETGLVSTSCGGSGGGFSSGQKACFLAGLNLRNGPCGSVVSTATGTVSGTVTNVVQGTCLGSTWNWVNIDNRYWGAVETGLVSKNCGGGGGGGGSSISVGQLQSIIPQLTTARANEVLSHLNQAMKEASINSCPRMSAFIAQLAHESGGLRWFEEFASGDAYEGRKDLCNTVPGDGRRFKGRGPIQLTGRCNYTAAGKDLRLDLVGNPAQVATVSVGFRTSTWYWNSRSLNQYADQHTQDSFDTITRRINGGLNGKADRDQYWRRAKSVLGC